MIPVMNKCDSCARKHDKLVDGWKTACDAFPSGIPSDYLFSNANRQVCNGGIGFKEKKPDGALERAIA